MSKVSSDKLESSLKTWLPVQEYASFHLTLKSFVQVLFMHHCPNRRKDHAKIIKRVCNKFSPENQADLKELVFRVANQFKHVTGAKQLLKEFPSPYLEDQEGNEGE
jgi:hypothetical protein